MGKKTIVIVLVAFSLGAMTAPPIVSAAQRVFDRSMSITSDQFQYLEVHRYDDPDFRVKCWTVEEYRGNAISCLPWSEVKER